MSNTIVILTECCPYSGCIDFASETLVGIDLWDEASNASSEAESMETFYRLHSIPERELTKSNAFSKAESMETGGPET